VGHAEANETTEFGSKSVGRRVLPGPGGRLAKVVMVSTILAGEEAPRFMTATPPAKGERRLK
jgi:hypothetical protein